MALLQQHGKWFNTKQGRYGAFSLVEMAVVVVIMGIFASVSIPRYASFISNQRAEAAARKIKMDLQYAKNRAKVSSLSRTVEFDVPGNVYRLIGEFDIDHPDTPYLVALSSAPYHAQLVSVDFNSTTTVTYDGYGVPDNNGTIVISVGNIIETIYVIKPDSVVLPGVN